MESPAEPLGTLEVALLHARRLLEREPAAAAEQANEILKVFPDQPNALAISGLVSGLCRLSQYSIAVSPSWLSTWCSTIRVT